LTCKRLCPVASFQAGRVVHVRTEERLAEEPFITVKEVAKLLVVSEHWVYQAVREGLIPAYRFGGVLRFKRSEMVKWVEDHHENPSDS